MSESDRPEPFDAMEAFLRSLEGGEISQLEVLKRRHPELASLFACMEGLHCLSVEVPRSETSVEPEGGEEDPLPPEVPKDLFDALSLIDSLPIRFDNYELLEVVGRGGMGVVFKARQVELDRIVAIKMLLGGKMASVEHLRRFRAEARAAANLHHPGVVRIFHVGSHRGQPFFAMEFIEGEPLDRRLQRAPFSPRESAALIARIADAVAHLHGRGVIHRDLKPSNILLDADDSPYVTDLGLAKALMDDSTETATGLILGTPCYMAPEQAAGHRGSIGPLSDVYSLGALLYEMLTGRPPFFEDTPMETVMQVIQGEPLGPRQISKNIPRQLELICLKCLSKTPQQRYASAEELRDDLSRYLRGETVQAKPPNLYQGTLRAIRRRPALSARWGVLGVFLVVESVNYRLGGVPPDFHRTVLFLMAIWALISFLGQWLIETRRRVVHACYLWGTLDALMLHAVLEEAAGVASPLVVGYPILIAASAIWLHRRFVWYITGLCALSYLTLVVEFYQTGKVLQIYPGFPTRFDRHIIFLVMLFSLATLLCYLIRRIQSLRRFCGYDEQVPGSERRRNTKKNDLPPPPT